MAIGGALLAGGDLLAPMGNLFAQQKPSNETDKFISVVEGDDPFKITIAAVDELGGMKKYVKNGDVVLVKPNIGWNRTVEQAANTNPMVVAAVVSECKKAGAKEVIVLDRTCNEARMCYRNSGIEEAANKAGANVVLFDGGREGNYRSVTFAKGKSVREWNILKMAIDANVLINVPIAKHHGISGLTFGMKNLMGLMAGERGKIHKDIHQSLADLLSGVRPHLTIVDAYRVLMNHGPQGGKLEDVKLVKKVIATSDPVAADAFAAGLPGLDKKPSEVGFIRIAHEMGLGEMNLSNMKIVEKKI